MTGFDFAFALFSLLLGLSVAETSAELRVPAGTVKSYTARGLATLEAILSDNIVGKVR